MADPVCSAPAGKLSPAPEAPSALPVKPFAVSLVYVAFAYSGWNAVAYEPSGAGRAPSGSRWSLRGPEETFPVPLSA